MSLRELKALGITVSEKSDSKTNSKQDDLKAHFSAEKDRLLEQIRALEDEVKLKADSAGSTTPTTVSTTSKVTLRLLFQLQWL